MPRRTGGYNRGMHFSLRGCFLSLLVAGALVTTATAQQQERASVPDRYKWDLTQIYPNDQAWRAAKDKLVEELPKISAFKGKLGSSPQELADALELTSRLSKEFSRLYVYASMTSDQDTRVSTYQGMQQEMTQIGANFAAESSFIEPEILKIDRATIDKFGGRRAAAEDLQAAIWTTSSGGARTR